MAEPFGDEIVALLPRLRRYAHGLTGSRDEGDDVVQAACERALARRDQFIAGSRLDSWMFRITQNIWIDRLRSRRVRQTDSDGDALDEVAGPPETARIEARMTLRKIEALIAGLPEEQRAVLMLVSVDGASYREAAEILEIPIGTVMSRLSRARVALGRALDGEVERRSGRTGDVEPVGAVG